MHLMRVQEALQILQCGKMWVKNLKWQYISAGVNAQQIGTTFGTFSTSTFKTQRKKNTFNCKNFVIVTAATMGGRVGVGKGGTSMKYPPSNANLLSIYARPNINSILFTKICCKKLNWSAKFQLLEHFWVNEGV
eukprot:TRINITY_DN8216_c0_g2_i6.p3 TRINITY_DN8216_c0_g2~~TRINITY_DN8216_c0_g2_i6.p3  ORF type:complete len:134 (+),score=8.03 TRINITY_DN8216_c0_g2_i6:72-473(+)